MKWISTRTHLRIAVGATAALYILLITLTAILAPAHQLVAVMAGGIAVALIYARLMQSDPPAKQKDSQSAGV